jgi:hypothetical protein
MAAVADPLSGRPIERGGYLCCRPAGIGGPQALPERRSVGSGRETFPPRGRDGKRNRRITPDAFIGSDPPHHPDDASPDVVAADLGFAGSRMPRWHLLGGLSEQPAACAIRSRLDGAGTDVNAEQAHRRIVS